MFDGDPQARAKDRDRDRAIYVVDAALRNGQISQQDRDLRVERVRSAATVGELGSLVRDIATPPAPVPPTAVVPPVPVPATSPATSPASTSPVTTPADPYAPGTQRPTVPVPSDLYGPPRSKQKSGSTRPVTFSTSRGPGRKVALGCLGVALTFFIGPIIAGVTLFSSQIGGGSDSGVATAEPVPAGPAFELSRVGIRDYIATFRDSFGDTQVVRAVFYDGYVVSWVRAGSGDVAVWNYLNGSFEQLGDPLDGTVEPAPVDLADLKPGRVMSLVDTAHATLNVDEPFTTYVMYDRNVVDDDPQVAVFVSNDAGQSGYLLGDLTGRVISTQAND